MSSKKRSIERNIIAHNKRAAFDYFVNESYEAGLVLLGSEVKSLRNNGASIGDAYANTEGDTLYLYNAHIAEYKEAGQFNHAPKRPRKLLLHKREIKRLIGLVQRKGATLVPLSMYFNAKNIVKIQLGVVTGKKQYDKRNSIKEREWQRNKARILKGALS